MNDTQLLATLLAAVLPPHLLLDFEITALEEKPTEWRIVLTERPERIPSALKDCEVSLNGYLNPIEVIDFPIREKLTYLTFIRRRWKQKGTTDDYSNTYELHVPGTKVTPSFGAFLKELTREEFDQLCLAWPNLRDCWQETR